MTFPIVFATTQLCSKQYISTSRAALRRARDAPKRGPHHRAAITGARKCYELTRYLRETYSYALIAQEQGLRSFLSNFLSFLFPFFVFPSSLFFSLPPSLFFLFASSPSSSSLAGPTARQNMFLIFSEGSEKNLGFFF